ncbi:MAG: hypothetical protein AB7S48_07115 [Bacteroidales bacterium]
MSKIINHLIIAAMVFSLFGCACTSTSRSNFKEDLTNKSDVYKILYYASLAGNSHNTQPWKVKVIKDSIIEVYADTSRHLKIVDPTYRGLFISLGAFIENINLSAGVLGYIANIDIKAQKSTDILAAIITLEKGKATNFNISEIEQRRTTRSAFEKRSLTVEDIKTIISNPESTSYISATSDNGKYISTKTLAAYAQQSNNEDAKNELANWLRFSNSDVKANRDGLTTGGMGITGIIGFIIRNFMKPSDSKKQSFVDKGIDKAKLQAENCAGWILITQPNNSPENWMNTGRLYERINIACSKLGIGFHPMNQMIEERNFEIDANAHFQNNGVIQFVARIGYLNSIPKSYSVRKSVLEFSEFIE